MSDVFAPTFDDDEPEELPLQTAEPAGPPPLTVVPQEDKPRIFAPDFDEEPATTALGPVPFENPNAADAKTGMALSAGVNAERNSRLEGISAKTGLTVGSISSLSDEQITIWEQKNVIDAISETGQHLVNHLKDPKKAAQFIGSLEALHRMEVAIRFKALGKKFEGQGFWKKNFANPMVKSYQQLRAAQNMSEVDLAAGREHGMALIDAAIEADPKNMKAVMDIAFGVTEGMPYNRATHKPDPILERYARVRISGNDGVKMREYNREQMSVDMRDRIDALKIMETVPKDVHFDRVVAQGTPVDILKHIIAEPMSLVRLMAESVVTSAPTLALGILNPALGFSASMYVEQVSHMEQALASRGVDVKNPEALLKAIRNRPLMKEVRAEGLRKGFGVAAIDMLGIMVAGRILAPRKIGQKVLTPTQRVAINLVPQTALQGVGEAAGEAGGSILATGDFSANEVLLEGLAGGGMSSVDVLAFGGKRIFQEIKIFKANKEAAARAAEWLADGEMAIENVKNVPAAVKHMQSVSEVMADKMAENGIDTVMIEADMLWEFHQESDEDILATLGVDEKEAQQAAVDGGLVEITAGAYSRHILGVAGFHALQEHTKAADDILTPAQAKEFEATGEDDVQARVEQTTNAVFDRLKGDPAQLVVLQKDFELIQQQFMEARLAGGGVTHAQAALEGMITAQRITSRAYQQSKETGEAIRPIEVWQKDNLTVEGPLTPATTQGRGDPDFQPVDPLQQNDQWQSILVEVDVLDEEGTRSRESVPAGEQFKAIQEKRKTARNLWECMGAT
jgi:hypothetical protein